MASVCLYFQVHQPYRLRRYSVFDTDRHYFDEHRNGDLCRKTAERCYLPANRVLLEAIREHEGRFRVAFSVTGVALEQFEKHAPDVIDSFRELHATGCVEFLAETFYHSLASLYSEAEFREQVAQHSALVGKLFGQSPRVFRNTELIYDNALARVVGDVGYGAVLTEGVDRMLGGRGPDVVYRPPEVPGMRVLLNNHRLSDDIAYRFGDRASEGLPVTAETFAQKVGAVGGVGRLCNLFMHYEALGEGQAAEAGIIDFLRAMPGAILAEGDSRFLTPSQVVEQFTPAGDLDVPQAISWADAERDLSPWRGNAMQTNALGELFKLERRLKEKGDAQLLADWRRISTSDHFYYMSTKFWADVAVRQYISPYESPYDSYINFMNVLDNVRARGRE